MQNSLLSLTMRLKIPISGVKISITWQKIHDTFTEKGKRDSEILRKLLPYCFFVIFVRTKSGMYNK